MLVLFVLYDLMNISPEQKISSDTTYILAYFSI
jgi:hypothetical protein